MDSAPAFLPSVERAKAAGLEIRVDRGVLRRERSLLEETPAEERRMLAIVVRGRVLHRNSWQRSEELTPRRLATLPRTRPPVGEDFTAQRFAFVVRVQTPERSCPHCSSTPGRAICTACHGQGLFFVSSDRPPDRCDPCNGSGFGPCGSCEGSARTHAVLMEYGEDQVAAVWQTFTPELPAEVDHALRVHFDAWPTFPDALAHDLESPASGGAPYRSNADAAPRRWGFSLLDARDARAMLARVRRESACHAVQAFTVPILVLVYGGGAIAVIAPAPDGGVVGFGGFVR